MKLGEYKDKVIAAGADPHDVMEIIVMSRDVGEAHILNDLKTNDPEAFARYEARQQAIFDKELARISAGETPEWKK